MPVEPPTMQLAEQIKALAEKGFSSGQIFDLGNLVLANADVIIAALEAQAWRGSAVAWLEAAWPNGSGSDFNQGVVRGFEIIKAQIEAGHFPIPSPPEASAYLTEQSK